MHNSINKFCRTNVTKNSGINMGIKLYNKLPPVIKNLEMTQEFKSRVKDFIFFRCYVNFIIII